MKGTYAFTFIKTKKSRPPNNEERLFLLSKIIVNTL